jgi:hypothetical protein
MNLMLLGAIAMANFTASLFFFKFWRRSRDRFFMFFALAFAIEGLIRIMLGVIHYSSEQEPLFYLVRLFSYVLILVAIIDKNRRGARP